MSQSLEERLRYLLDRVSGRGSAPPVRDSRFRGQPPSRMIVGLGNPGSRYANNRHNVGFMVIDALAEAVGVMVSRSMNGALVGDTIIDSTPTLLVKPQTYMNLSGQAVHRLASWFKLEPRDVLVVYDDIDLPLGKVRIRERGSAGGHRGMKSILDHLGTQDVPRIKIGIGRSLTRPAEEYVLEDFRPDERPVITEAIKKAVEAAKCVVAEGTEPAMARFN